MNVPLHEEYGPHPIEFDEEKGYLVNTNTGEKYIAVKAKDGVEDLRQKLQSDRKRKDLSRRGLKTPIFHDPTTGKYYYPEVSFLENEKVRRNIVEGPNPLELDEHNMLWTHPKTMEKYREFDSKEQYLREWAENAEKLDRENDKKIAQRTPVFFDKKFKKYYFPECALTELPEMIPRKVHKCTKKKRCPLFYNERMGVFQHNITEARYIEADNPDQFEDLRREILRLPPIEKPPLTPEEEREARIALAQKTPIYHHDDKFYYPEVALTEMEPTTRRTIKGQHPLVFDGETEDFIDPVTKEKYVEFNNVEEFHAQRGLFLEAEVEKQQELEMEKLREVADMTPIYFDETEVKFYYPECALKEKIAVERVIVSVVAGDLPLTLTKRVYYHTETKAR